MNLDDPNILNVYRYGSHVYGTAHEGSDEDFIVITKEPVISDDVNIHYYTEAEFSLMLERHDIAALECINTSHKAKLKYEKLIGVNFTVDKSKLRTSISTISSNSWVKGKKKLTVTGDYDKYAGIKSIFHSLRILDYGIQLGLYGQINDFGNMNHVFHELMKMSANEEGETLWSAIETKFKKDFNTKSSTFKELCPKDLTEKDRKVQLKKIIDKYDVADAAGLLDEILTTLKL